MDSPVATNIRLPRRALEELKIRAARERKSVAQLIREALARTFGIGGEPAAADPKRDPFYRLIGSVESGIRDGAERHDRDIYGAGD